MLTSSMYAKPFSAVKNVNVFPELLYLIFAVPFLLDGHGSLRFSS
jgi:hypothetical protein